MTKIKTRWQHFDKARVHQGKTRHSMSKARLNQQELHFGKSALNSINRKITSAMFKGLLLWCVIMNRNTSCGASNSLRSLSHRQDTSEVRPSNAETDLRHTISSMD